MAEITITVAELNPDQAKQYVDGVLRILDFGKILNIPKVDAVVDLAHKVLERPATINFIVAAWALWSTNWKTDVDVFVTAMKK